MTLPSSRLTNLLVAYRAPSRWLHIVVLAVLYFAFGSLGLTVPFESAFVTLIWPCTGIALAALIRLGLGVWPGVWLGAMAIHLITSRDTFDVAFWISTSNALGMVITAYALRQLNFHSDLDRRRDVWLLLGVGAMAGMTLTATGGVSVIYHYDMVSADRLVSAWLVWWLGDAVGVLIVGAPLLALHRVNIRQAFSGLQGVETLLLFGVLATSNYLLFFHTNAAFTSSALIFIPFLLLTWLAIRAGVGVSSLAALMLSGMAAIATTIGKGPFATLNLHDGLAMLWGYMATVSIITLLVTSLIAELFTNERRWQFALDGADVGVWDWHVPSERMYYSPHWRALLGLGVDAPGEKIVGWISRVHPDDYTQFAEALEAYRRDTTTAGQSLTLRFRHGNGHWLWCQVQGRIVQRDAHNHPVRVIGTLADITQQKRAADHEQEARELYQAMFDTNNAIKLLLDPVTGQIVDVNQAAVLFYGYDRPTLLSMQLDQINTLTLPEIIAIVADARARGKFFFEFSHRLASGEIRQVEVHTGPVRVAGRELMFSIIHDITTRKAAEKRLRFTASVFEHAHEGIMITDPESRIVEVNHTFTDITGYARDEVIGRDAAMLHSGYHSEAFYHEMSNTLHTKGYWRGETWSRRKNGEVYPELLTLSAVRTEQGEVEHYVAVFSDISELKEHQQKLERMAHYDALTQLPNRVLLADRMLFALGQAQQTGQLLAVCYLDLDGFKPVNDIHGHEVGDALLVEIARRFRRTIRGGDTVARLGGDEFVLLLTGLEDIAHCKQALERILHVVAEPCPVREGLALMLSASIGVTLYPNDGADVDTLLRHADQAMYLAKQAGRNRYHLFDPEHDRQAYVQREALARIETGLAAGEFVLFYQPKVDMRQGTVIGAEALIRWIHPERGLIPPGEFLPILEGSEFAITLGEWVINTALLQLRTWRNAHGLILPVSVNIAGQHLQHPEFCTRLAALLATVPDVNPNLLELEVLETAALDDIAYVSDLMENCRTLGVTFALDDFGTGYSSLTYLKRLPADILKIDQSFVRDMLKDPEDLAITEGVIGLAQAFRRNVIAEGVETIEHGAMLIQLGCNLAQGYGIARPMPAAAFPDWVTNFVAPPLWQEAASHIWPRDDLPLLGARIDHDHWVERLVEVLMRGSTHMPHPSTAHECRFGHWYRGVGLRRYGNMPAFSHINPIHQAVHALGAELFALMESEPDTVKARLPELYDLRIQMLDALADLLRSVAILPTPVQAIVTRPTEPVHSEAAHDGLSCVAEVSPQHPAL